MLKKDYSNYSDAQLILEYQEGKVRAFDQLVLDYKKPLFAYLFRMVNSREIAEDLIQDVFMKVSVGLKNYSERNKFRNWLFGIAYRVIIDYQRKNSKKNNLFTNSVSDHFESQKLIENPSKNLEQKELKNILELAIDNLPNKQKQVLLLKEHSGMTFKEISELLNRPLNTVLAQNRYALNKLKKFLTKKYGKEIQHVLQ